MVSVSTVLSELDVGGNALGDMGVAAIAQALPSSPTLAVLSLGANALGDAGAVALAQALRVNKVVTTLTLGGNSIGDTNTLIPNLSRYSSRGDPNPNPCSPNPYTPSNPITVGDKGAAAIAEALKTNAVLKELVIGAQSIGAAGASALGEALKVNKVLKELSLTGNSIGDAGATALAAALRVNNALTVLDARSCSIRTEGGKAIAEALEVNGGAGRALELTLMDNFIGGAGIAAIGKVLRPNAITAPHLDAQVGRRSVRGAAEWV